MRSVCPIAIALGVAIGCEGGGSRDHDASGSSTDGVASTSGADDTGDVGSTGDGSGDVDETGVGDESSSDSGEPDPPSGPVFYPADRVHSPIDAWVADGLRAIASVDDAWQPDVFMKVGDSVTASPNNLACFAEGPVDLDVHAALDGTLQHFLVDVEPGITPFDRQTLAAAVGQNAGWATSGMPSPVDAEIAAIAPAFALVQYGGNDMNLGTTFASAMPGFYENMTVLLDGLVDRGIVPIVFGMTRRGDDPEAQKWAATYNAVIRGLAQARQIPFVDTFLAIDAIPGHGLGPDDLHLDAYVDGACILDPAGLQHGYNLRNLISLEALDRAREVVVDGEAAIDRAAPRVAGSGTHDDPFVIDALPWSDARDTASDGVAQLDAYACDAADESGPEIVYRLELGSDTPVRAMVLDREGVDVDLHVLAEPASPRSCVARDDTMIETTLAAGEWTLVVDTYDAGAGALVGAYLLVVVACDGDDADCAT
jgi:hypothetical protein